MGEQTNGPEVHLSRGPDAGVECNTLARLTPAVPFDQRAAVTCTRCLHTVLALTEDGCDRWRQRAKQAEARIAELEAALRWVPVTEQLPPLGDPVLVLCEDGPLVMSLRANGAMSSGYHWEGPSPWYGSVFSHRDHWRPLPDGPEAAT